MPAIIAFWVGIIIPVAMSMPVGCSASRTCNPLRRNPYCQQGERALRFPYGLCQSGSRLIAADTANNRIMIWQLPLSNQAYVGAVDLIGQQDFDHCGENHWRSVARDSLCWPYGVAGAW